MGIVFNKRGLLPAPVAVFRVDAGAGIGMGHFMRCRTLAFAMLKRGWVVCFIGSGLPEELMGFKTVNSIISLIEFKPLQDTMQENKKFLEMIRTIFGDDLRFIVFDSYRFNRDDYALLQMFGNRVPVAVINDLGEQDTPAQVVINPNPLFSPEPYKRQKIPCILCGEKYTLIRPEIVSRRNRVYNPAGPLLISLGGGDVSEPLLKMLDLLPEHLEKSVIVSVSGKCPLDDLLKWQAVNPEKRHINTSVEDFPKLLASASVAITGGGTTLWEVYCLGIPSLCIVWVDNQKNASAIIKDQATSFLVDTISHINMDMQSELLDKGLEKLVETFGPPGRTRLIHEKGYTTSEVVKAKNTSLAVEDIEERKFKFIRRSLLRLSSDCDFPRLMVQKQRELIDGRGAERIVDALEKTGWTPVPLFDADYRRAYEDW
jgi:spore coat polysaccharide biosynthesis predicted glycosyltransferase SpsG